MATVGVKGVYSIEQLLPAANLLNEILQKSEDTVIIIIIIILSFI